VQRLRKTANDESSGAPEAARSPAASVSAALTGATYRRLLDLAPDAVVVADTQGRIVLANMQTQRLFGYPPEELIGQPVEVLVPPRFRGVHPGHRESYKAHPSVRPMGAGRELSGLRKDGTEFAAEISLSPVAVEEGMLFATVIRDISERRRTEQELKLLKSLALGISGAPDLARAMSVALETACRAADWDYGDCWIPRADGAAIEAGSIWRRPGADLEGYRLSATTLPRGRRGGLVGRVWETGQAETIPDLHEADGSAFIAGEPRDVPGLKGALAVPVLSGPDVVAVMRFMSRQPMEADRRLAEVVSAAVAPLGPVVQQKRVEDELQHHRQNLQELVAQRTQQLETTHEQLRQADRLAVMGTLAAGLGHDMNNVLFPVRCRLDTMEQSLAGRGGAGATAEGLRTVRHSVEYLQRLSDGLHLLALDPQDPEASGQTTELADWWDQVEPILRKAVGGHARFEAEIPRGLPPIGVAPHRLTQAVLNLIVNASDALGDAKAQGLVRLSAEAMADGRFVRLAVKDNGCGMTDEVRRRAQDPFFTTKKRGLGTGLGLALVRGTVQSAGGTIDIESAPGAGTSVALTLPVAMRAPVAVAGGPLTAYITVREPRLASMVQGFLEAAGFEVAAGGAEAPAHARLWVAACPPAMPESLSRFLESDPRRQVLIVEGKGPGRYRNMIQIRDPEDFEAVRDGIAAAVRAATRAES
jgi:PAS domain S-box-containing protein